MCVCVVCVYELFYSAVDMLTFLHCPTCLCQKILRMLFVFSDCIHFCRVINMKDTCRLKL